MSQQIGGFLDVLKWFPPFTAAVTVLQAVTKPVVDTYAEAITDLTNRYGNPTSCEDAKAKMSALISEVNASNSYDVKTAAEVVYPVLQAYISKTCALTNTNTQNNTTNNQNKTNLLPLLGIAAVAYILLKR